MEQCNMLIGNSLFNFFLVVIFFLPLFILIEYAAACFIRRGAEVC